jgi:hypothetical protein
VLAVVAWGVAVAALPRLAWAAPIPPAPVAAIDDLEALRAALEEKLIRARLSELGVSEADVARLLERLAPDERAELAARTAELATGGNAAAVLAVAIIVTGVVILILELLGRRVISRPP